MEATIQPPTLPENDTDQERNREAQQKQLIDALIEKLKTENPGLLRLLHEKSGDALKSPTPVSEPTPAPEVPITSSETPVTVEEKIKVDTAVEKFQAIIRELQARTQNDLHKRVLGEIHDMAKLKYVFNLPEMDANTVVDLINGALSIMPPEYKQLIHIDAKKEGINSYKEVSVWIGENPSSSQSNENDKQFNPADVIITPQENLLKSHPLLLWDRSRSQVIIGRPNPEDPTYKPDIDLTSYAETTPNAFSRKQVVITPSADGHLSIENTGSVPMWVNGVEIPTNGKQPVKEGDIIKVKGVRINLRLAKQGDQFSLIQA